MIHTPMHTKLSLTDTFDSLTWEFVFMAQSKQAFHFCKRYEVIHGYYGYNKDKSRKKQKAKQNKHA